MKEPISVFRDRIVEIHCRFDAVMARNATTAYHQFRSKQAACIIGGAAMGAFLGWAIIGIPA